MQLHEQYRPTTWADVVGQDKVIEKIRRLAKRKLLRGAGVSAPPHPAVRGNRNDWSSAGSSLNDPSS